MNAWVRTLWLALAGTANAFADRLEAIGRLLRAAIALGRDLRPAAPDRLAAPVTASSTPAYETISLDLSLVIEDAKGERATLTRRQRLRCDAGRPSLVRELVWGEGRQLVRYRAQGARRVGLRAEGSKRAVLLEPADATGARGSSVITSRRVIRGGFATAQEYCEAFLERPTERLRFAVLFPVTRPPRTAWLVLAAREEILRTVPVRYGADGRARLRCSLRAPLVGMTYSLRWTW